MTIAQLFFFRVGVNITACWLIHVIACHLSGEPTSNALSWFFICSVAGAGLLTLRRKRGIV